MLELVGERTGSRANTAVAGTVWLPFEVSGQRSRRLAEARAFVNVAQRSLVEVRANAAAEGIRAYGAVVVAANRVRLLEEIVATAAREAELYDARLESGDTTELDARLAEVELLKNQALLQEFRADVKAGLTRIQRLLGTRYSRVESPPWPPEPSELARTKSQTLPALARLRAESEYYARSKERARSEGKPPVSLMLIGGRGEFGDVRLGAGLAYAFPLFRYNQGEQAEAEGERRRADEERRVRSRSLRVRLSGLFAELEQLKKADQTLRDRAIPAAAKAVTAAVATHRLGKSELLSVLVTRRDLALLRLRALDLAQREWTKLAELVELAGARR